MTADILKILAGLVLLTVGGDALIRGAVAVARRLGISPLLTGLVIVGFGTSTPELAVSLDAALSGRPALAVGNVVGSNIANVLLILGLCALITPLIVKPLALRRDAATMLAATVLLLLLAGDSVLTRSDGLLLLACMTAYLIWAIRTERMGGGPVESLRQAEAEVLPPRRLSGPLTALSLGLGLPVLILGARLLVSGASRLALALGASESAVGLTVVAVGTSLPELTVSVIASLKRQPDVAVGNILGSNIFNILFILGTTTLVRPLPLDPRILQVDRWVLLAVAVLITWFLATGRRLDRVEGGILLGGYVAYVTLGVA